MSLTESKAKSAKKSTAKTAVSEAESNALKMALEQAAIQAVPLSALVKSPLNVRYIPYTKESVEGLATSIANIGLLQNLIVHTLPDGQLGVAAGGRRFTALQLLVEREVITVDYSVIVKIIPDELVIAASLTENGERKDMHPAEQIVGFRAMAEEGKTPAQIGDLLGYGSRHVQRMLKLARLAPSILDALAKDELTTEHCHAFALEDDQYRQHEIFEAVKTSSAHIMPRVYEIKRLITDSEVSTDCEKFKFVGEEAFADNEIRRDLFSEEEGGYVSAALLDRRVEEKLQKLATAMQQEEGWSWSLGRIKEISHYGEDSLIFDPSPAPAPDIECLPEEQEKFDALSEQLDSLTADCEESYAIEAEIKAIEKAAVIRCWPSERKATQGVVLSLDYYGALVVQRGVLRKEPKEETTESEINNQNEVEYEGVHVIEKKPEPVDAISLPLLTKMSSERTLAVQAALMQQTPKAVALLVWTLCCNVFSKRSSSQNPLKVSLSCSHYSLCDNAPSGEEGTAYLELMKEKERLTALLPEGWEKDFTSFFTLEGKVLMALMGFCVACGIDGVQTRECNRTTASPLDKLESALSFNMRDWWQPTKANFFDLLKKPQIVEALNEVGATDAASQAENMKKGDASALAENRMAGNRWVPVWMQGPQPVEPEAQDEDSMVSEQNPTANAA